MADVYQWFIRFLHVYSGLMWVGGIALWGMVIAPRLTREVPPQARGPVMAVIAPRVARYFGIAGVVTVITGFWNMGLIVGFGGIVDAFQDTTWGMTLGASFVLALIMLALAIFVIIPTTNRMLELGKKAAETQSPPPAEMAGLQKKVMMGGMANLLLGTIAIALMAWASAFGP